MKSKSKGALFLTGGLLLVTSIVVFVMSFNTVFKANNYWFNFSDMGNPERALIGFVLSVALLLPAILIKTKD